MAAKACLILVLVVATFINITYSEDPDILTDFVLPSGVSASPAFFTFSGLRAVFQKSPPTSPFMSKVTQLEFPALNGQGVSMALLKFGPNGINPLHTHPRSAEMLVVVQGTLEVGFVDTKNKLFTQTLQTGDVFVFPKGMVHFQLNRDYKKPAIAISAFGSANAGTVALPTALFSSGVAKDVLAKSFKTDVDTIAKLVSSPTMG